MSASKTQAVGQVRSSEDQVHSHEEIGNLDGCTFDISTVIPPGTYGIDGRLPTTIQPGMSAIDFRRLLCEHRVSSITFAWDVRELAREVFHLLAIQFESHKPTVVPHTVVTRHG